MADGGIGEAALLSEAGGSGAIGGGIAGSAAADAGAEFGTDAAFNAANTASLGSEFGTPEAFNAANAAQMDLSSPEASFLESMPSGPGVPKSAALNASQQAVNAATQAQQTAAPILNTPPPAAMQSAGTEFNSSTAGLPGSSFNGPPSAMSSNAIAGQLGQVGSSASPFSSISNLWNSASSWAQQNPKSAMALGGVAGIYALMKNGAFSPNYMTPFKPQTAQQVGLGRTLSPQYRPTFAAAKGGIASLAIGGMPGQQYPMSQINYNGYNAPTQMPTSALNMEGYQPSNTPLSGALEQNMASGGSASSAAPTGITAAGESTGNGLNIYTPSASNNGVSAQLAALASQYGVSLPTTMAAEGGIMGLSTGGDPLVEMAAQRQNNAIDPRTGIPYSQEQYGNNSSFLGGLSQGISGLGQDIGNGVSSIGRSLGFAQGGHTDRTYNLGGYSDGGRLLKGPGDGMSDDIPASIADKQPARLADGEFVVPADVVSHLGNGSTDAGAKHLYAMMDKVRHARTGSKKQGKQIQSEKYLPT